MCQVMYLSAQLPVRVGQLIKFHSASTGCFKPRNTVFSNNFLRFLEADSIWTYFFQQFFFAKKRHASTFGRSKSTKKVEFFFCFPRFLSSPRSSAGFLGGIFSTHGPTTTPSVSKAPSPAAWAYPAQVLTERGSDSLTLRI